MTRPGIYCFINTINGKVYIGSSKDLDKRIKQHIKGKGSNHLYNSICAYGLDAFIIKTWEIDATPENLLLVEQIVIDELGLFDKKGKPIKRLTYNIACKTGGNPGGTKERQKELCEAAGGSKAKPFYIKSLEGLVVMQCESTYDTKVQGFLSWKFDRISSQLNDKNSLLYFKLNNQIYYLEYVDETLWERAKRLGRCLETDLKKVQDFKSEISVISGGVKPGSGVVTKLSGYATYCDAALQLGLSTKSELSGFCRMVSGKRPSVRGYRLG